MDTSIVIVGLVLGILQLMAGVALGYWLRTPAKPASGEAEEDRKRAQRLSAELRTLTAQLSCHARNQGEMLGKVEHRLQSELAQDASLAEHPITSLVTGVVREMMTANLALQQKLAHAELEIESQASELSEHRRLAMTDPLTGLPNRRALDDHLRLRMEAWRRHHTPFSLLMLDIDHFKQFNDQHGHPAGDQALKTAASALRSALRQHDVVARYGGEEFAVILPHTDIDSSRAAVHKALEAIRDCSVVVQGDAFSLTASGGLASIVELEPAEDLLHRADQALYAAKQNGRDQAWLHDASGTCPLEPACAAAPLDDPFLESVCGDLRNSVATLLAD